MRKLTICGCDAAGYTIVLKPAPEAAEKTAANLLLRVNGGDWVTAEGLRLKQGDTLEYRLELYAYNCLRTPRIEKVVIEME